MDFIKLIEEIKTKVKKYYILDKKVPEVIKSLDDIISNWSDMSEINDNYKIADTLTNLLIEASGDGHFGVIFRKSNNEDQKGIQRTKSEIDKNLREQAEYHNYGFTKLEILPGNVGYVNLRYFIDPKFGGKTAHAMMNFMSSTFALIFDLRNSNGGNPQMVQLLSSYLLEEPQVINTMYRRFDNRTDQYWTQYLINVDTYYIKPVYILVDKETYSADEAFAYNLQHLKRATIVGEQTKGGAHPSRLIEILYGFFINLPIAKAINPITGTNWEGVGVIPDFEVQSVEALNHAYQHALSSIDSDKLNKHVKKLFNKDIELIN